MAGFIQNIGKYFDITDRSVCKASQYEAGSRHGQRKRREISDARKPIQWLAFVSAVEY